MLSRWERHASRSDTRSARCSQCGEGGLAKQTRKLSPHVQSMTGTTGKLGQMERRASRSDTRSARCSQCGEGGLAKQTRKLSPHVQSRKGVAGKSLARDGFFKIGKLINIWDFEQSPELQSMQCWDVQHSSSFEHARNCVSLQESFSREVCLARNAR